jgi:hypothetical protein
MSDAILERGISPVRRRSRPAHLRCAGHRRRARPAWPAPSTRRTPAFASSLVDKGCLCNSLYHYPAHMTFFTTPELLEIGNIPFPSPNQKPNRTRRCSITARSRRITSWMCGSTRQSSGSPARTARFQVHLRDRFERPSHLSARKLIVATGYYDLPNYLRFRARISPK